jgi:hypothetical protein
MCAVLVWVLLSGTCFGQSSDVVSGTWKINTARSAFGENDRSKILVARIERHPKGEVFTLDSIETNGRKTSYNTILYLDGEPRRLEDFGCSGIQTSRRADDRTVEILRMCASGEWVRLLRHLSVQADELILLITEQSADGRRFDRRLTLEKQ